MNLERQNELWADIRRAALRELDNPVSPLSQAMNRIWTDEVVAEIAELYRQEA